MNIIVVWKFFSRGLSRHRALAYGLPAHISPTSISLSLSLSLPEGFLQSQGSLYREMPEIPYTHGHPSIVRGGSWTNTETSPPHLKILLCVQFSSVQYSSVTQLCPTLCNPMDCSTPCLPVHHQLLKLPKLIPSNHLILCRPLLLPPSIFPSIRVF